VSAPCRHQSENQFLIQIAHGIESRADSNDVTLSQNGVRCLHPPHPGRDIDA
jgi:hypothetical protein